MSEKKYKTWEVIKELGDNSNKIFQLNAPYGMVIASKNECIVDVTHDHIKKLNQRFCGHLKVHFGQKLNNLLHGKKLLKLGLTRFIL